MFLYEKDKEPQKFLIKFQSFIDKSLVKIFEWSHSMLAPGKQTCL